MINPRPTAAWGYVRRIKNAAKKEYAEKYFDYCDGNGPEPERPKNLSYMGAQAVRIHLSNLGVNPPE